MDVETLHNFNAKRRAALAEYAAKAALSPEERGTLVKVKEIELTARHSAVMARMEEVCSRLGLSDVHGVKELVLAFEDESNETLQARVDTQRSVIEVGYFVSDLEDPSQREDLGQYDYFVSTFGGDGVAAFVTFHGDHASWRGGDDSVADRSKVLDYAQQQIENLESSSRMLLNALSPHM